ncbi:response regulator receiver modulated diguanylate cyclase [Thiohalospira halophila DSM 15071]|uniref:diguanylate cyclase n=1 Tax=Thiohalospira halophila DSM 15071 TaxID=1123397 RepID=A0A1I1P8Z9_9GAMM|nr:diguanylate cyclase [Thiohalospira halophila]SFD02490.1 response regulator receiver modulated diguanylate cyclase [Thiohalospira halophila DSM 15071]
MSDEEQKQTILVVDDEPANIQALGNLLKDEYRIRIANSGEKALAMVQDGDQPPPDLILLDIQMPGIDGYEVCRRLKAQPETSGIAIIFVTARDSASDEEYGLNLGAVDYIAKPFNQAIVRARVNTHMSLKRKTDLLERYALLDGLTGIPNRRHFDNLFEKEARRCLREGQPLSVIMMDIDHFKGFNDHYGHGAGDQCLQRVADALNGAMARPGDALCRYGGEEFVALLPGTDAEGAREVAEHLRQAVEGLAITHKYSSVGPVVTVSLGTATLDTNRDPEADRKSLLKSADEALYSAKEAGRNRVG